MSSTSWYFSPGVLGRGYNPRVATASAGEAPVFDDEPADGPASPEKGGEEPRDRAVLPDESSASSLELGRRTERRARVPSPGPPRRRPSGRGPRRLSPGQDRERGLPGSHHPQHRAAFRTASGAAAPQVHRHPRQPRPRARSRRAELRRQPADRGIDPGPHPAPADPAGRGTGAHPGPGPALRSGRGGECGQPTRGGARAPPRRGQGAAPGLPAQRAHRAALARGHRRVRRRSGERPRPRTTASSAPTRWPNPC